MAPDTQNQDKLTPKFFRIKPEEESTLNNLIELAYLYHLIPEPTLQSYLHWASMELGFEYLKAAAKQEGVT